MEIRDPQVDQLEVTAPGRGGAALGRVVLRVLEPRVAGPLVGAAVFVVAAVVIHRLSADVHLSDVTGALAAVPPSALIAALSFTLVSFVAMSFYDVLAVRQVAPGKVTDRFALFAGFVGYSISNAVGFHVFVGGPVRYRLYGARGLDAADAGRIVAVSFFTYSLGLAALIGAALVFDPLGIPWLQSLGPAVDRALGAAILIALAGLVAWLAAGPRAVHALGWRLPLPGAPWALLQMLVGAVDVGAACAALYVLLPGDVAPSFAAFLVLFLAAIVFGAVSHAPGGLGVLEATVLVGLGAVGRADVIAALILFRAVYYILPLLVGGTALAVFEIGRVRARLAGVERRAMAVARRIAPPVLAGLVFLGGLVLLLSGSTPPEQSRMALLRSFVPLPFAEASHMLASLVGLTLIVLARGLFRRSSTACAASVLLLLAGAAFSLLKGLDWEEAVVLVAVAGLLVAFHGAFYRRGGWRSFRPDPRWLAVMILAVAGLTLVGLLAFRHVEYRDQLWWSFAWHGDAPRFLRAALAAGVATLALGIDSFLNRPPQAGIGRTGIPDDIRPILAASPATQGQLALLGDKRFLVSDEKGAFLMYGVRRRSWIAMGDPVGGPQEGRDLVWRLAEEADRAGARAVFYEVGSGMLPVYLDLGLAILKIGEVARVPLPDFSLEGPHRQGLRYSDRRAAREGLAFEVVEKAEVSALLPELRSVSDAWLQTKRVREKGFSLGRFDPAYLSEFDVAVMRRDDEIVAFANIWRGAQRHEISIDLMRYRPDVSKVLMEAFFVRLMLYGRGEGYEWFSLGAAPLAGLSDHPLASVWNRLGTFVYRHGEEVYNFEGLRTFKQKFDPVWTPHYLACPGGLGIAQTLLDVASLISGGTAGVFRR